MRKEEFEVLYNLEGKYWWFLGRMRIAFSMLNRHLKESNLKILDAGCGTGKNMEYLQKYGSVQGVDLSEEALSFCKKRELNSVKGDVEHLPYPDDTFDLVTCFGVLYHKGVQDDQVGIKELERVCKPGGLVLITTPATEFLAKPFWLSQHDLSQHTGRRHSKKWLRRLQQRAGLKVLEITYMNTLLMPLIILVRLIKKILPGKEFKSELQLPSRIVNKFLLGILKLENFLIKQVSLPFGLTLVSVARKR